MVETAVAGDGGVGGGGRWRLYGNEAGGHNKTTVDVTRKNIHRATGMWAHMSET